MSHNLTQELKFVMTGAPYIVVKYNVISDEQFKIIQYAYYHFLWPSLSLIGLVFNMVNITVFVKIGLHDSVTVSFFILSIIDVCYVVCSGISVGLFIFAYTIVPYDRLRAYGIYALGSYIISLSEAFFNMSLGITTYIAVVKCCCVARPLTFKFAFTIRRTVAGILLISLVVVVTNIPRYTTFGMHSAANTTILEMWFSSEFESVDAAHKLLNRTVYPNFVLGVVIICSLILTQALRQAAKFRRGITEATLKHSPKHSGFDIPQIANDSEHAVGEHTIGERADDDTAMLTDIVRPVELMSSKELRVIKAVTVVSGFLLAEAFVVSAIALATWFVPGFSPLGQYEHLHSAIRFMEVICIHVTVIANTGIYFKFNSRFRAFVRSMAATLCPKCATV